ncbi:hypothetical protein M422DRAFT_266093 [Sphaerobolus stellatus SS14]|uniref:Uncharacterized protein n=1 Tax=Sphaerobolus stellatus (strain SS14) TaxID=990650 RepID=A0A0C9V3Z4_SPHS4|nr:hypothetical protein M422DRAFT_266093 [Sphaerobolus stellatus SS14]
MTVKLKLAQEELDEESGVWKEEEEEKKRRKARIIERRRHIPKPLLFKIKKQTVVTSAVLRWLCMLGGILLEEGWVEDLEAMGWAGLQRG